MNRPCFAAALAAAGVLAAHTASAHVVAGARVVPVTLTLDDPGTADEASIPTITYQRSGANGGPGPQHEVDFGFEYDKTITSNTALIANYGTNIYQIDHGSTRGGLQNLYITGKWQAYTNAAHEFVVSLGVIREFAPTGTVSTGADQYGSTAPTGYFGKGLGDLPIGVLRPFAVTGELSYVIADKALKATQTTDPSSGLMSLQYNAGAPNQWTGGFSVQYSIPYLQAQVKDFGLPHFIGNLIPLVEVTFSTPASRPNQQGTAWTIAPGVIYLGHDYQVGLEALIPGNRTAGQNVGVIAQFHIFLDDLLPNSLGKPLLDF